MSSELAVVTTEIVDILPKQHQTLANQEWIEDELKNNSIQEVLAAIQHHFGVSNRAIATCEKRLDQMGAKLDSHIAYTDQKFAAMGSEISQLKQEIAVTKAVSEVQAANQQFLTGQMMNSMNSINQNVATVATKSNKVVGYPDPTLWAIGAAAALMLFFVVSMRIETQKKPDVPTQKAQQQTDVYNCGGSRVRDGAVDFANCKKTAGDEI